MKNIFDSFLSKSDKQIAFTLLLVTFIIRAIYATVYYYINYPPESYLYYRIAELILKQGRIFYSTVNEYQNVSGPVLPWLNALTMLIFGKNYLGLYIVSAFGSGLITFFTYKTARLFLDKKISLLIGSWSMFYLFYFFYTPTPGKDIWMSFLLIYLIYLLIDLFINNDFRYSRFFVFILAYVISLHLDERFIVFAPFIFLFILYYETNSFKKFALRKSFLFVFLVILLMLPWAIRNYYEYDKFVLLTPRTERFTDKIFGYEQKDYFSDDFNSIKGTYYIHDYQLDSVITGLKTITDGGYKIPAVQIEAMKNGDLPAPLTGFAAFFSRLKTMFEPIQIKGDFERTGYYYYKKSLRQNIATFLFYGVLFIFSFPGFYYLFKINSAIFVLFLGTIIIYALLHALTIPYTNWRYRLPLDSLIIISGCFGIDKMYKKYIKRSF